MLKDIYESQILPRATVEELWQLRVVFSLVLLVGEDLRIVARWVRIANSWSWSSIWCSVAGGCIWRLHWCCCPFEVDQWHNLKYGRDAVVWIYFGENTFRRWALGQLIFFIKVSHVNQVLPRYLLQSVENQVRILFWTVKNPKLRWLIVSFSPNRAQTIHWSVRSFFWTLEQKSHQTKQGQLLPPRTLDTKDSREPTRAT